MPDTDQILVNERTACHLLGDVSAKSLFNWRKHGLPHVKLGTRVLYDPAALRRWVEERARQEVA